MTTIQALELTLSNVFTFYFKAHGFHWNITGLHFSQLHAFFGDVYSMAFAEVDEIAERIRIEGGFAPVSLPEIYKHSSLHESTLAGGVPLAMLAELAQDNRVIITNLNDVFAAASAINNQGLADFAAGLIDAHNKLGWKIESHLK